MSPKSQPIALAVLVLVLLSAAWALGDRLACLPESPGAVKILQAMPKDAPSDYKPDFCYGIEISHEYRTYGLPSAKTLKKFTLGFDKMIADLMFVNVTASTRWNEKNPGFVEWVYKMGDAITELHPKYEFVYASIGTYLSFHKDQIELSNAIFEKGTKALPDNYIMPFYIAYNYYWQLGEKEKAAPYFAEACKRPDAPAHMCTLAAKLMVKNQADPFEATNLMIAGFCANAQEERARIIRVDFNERVLAHVDDPEKRAWLKSYFDERIAACRAAFEEGK